MKGNVKGKTKRPKVAGFMRSILAFNTQLLMDKHYEKSSNKPKALAKDSQVRMSTIQRMLKAENGASLDTIEQVAAAFNLSAYQLLIPNLHISNPQVIKGATKDEERLYRSWKKSGTLLPFEEEAQ